MCGDPWSVVQIAWRGGNQQQSEQQQDRINPQGRAGPRRGVRGLAHGLEIRFKRIPPSAGNSKSDQRIAVANSDAVTDGVSISRASCELSDLLLATDTSTLYL